MFRHTPNRSAYIPLVEILENRTLLSISPLPATPFFQTVQLASGVVTIRGNDHAETVEIEQISSSDGSRTQIVIDYRDNETNSSIVRFYDASAVNSIVFYAQDGDDRFLNTTQKPTTVYGDEGRDTLEGGSGRDIFYGGPGIDTLYGNHGNDELHGENGDDVVHGGQGRDTIYGGDDKDAIEGGPQNDTIDGGNGADTINGGDGHDTINGGNGNDTVNGGSENDTINGGEGDDHLLGGTEIDTIHGDDGADILEGGDGDDHLYGDIGNDRLYGGAGRDDLHAGDGDDSLWGGGGIDELSDGAGDDRFLLDIDTDLDDVITSQDPQDVRVYFQDTTREHADGVDWTAGAWTYAEIVEVDEALAALVNETGNNALLRTSNGYFLHMLRVGDPIGASDASAWNTDGTGFLAFSDDVFDDFHADGGDHRTSDDDWLHHAVIHEIGHNWDDENANWGDWKNISDWRNDLFNGWEIHGSVGFASSYARESPKEDFAESFALYFAILMGDDFNDNDAEGIADRMPTKMAFMEDFIDSL